MSSFNTEFEEVAEEQGWSIITQRDLLLKFITENDLEISLEEFARNQQIEEKSISGAEDLPWDYGSEFDIGLDRDDDLLSDD
jgi:hypothetical protein